MTKYDQQEVSNAKLKNNKYDCLKPSNPSTENMSETSSLSTGWLEKSKFVEGVLLENRGFVASLWILEGGVSKWYLRNAVLNTPMASNLHEMTMRTETAKSTSKESRIPALTNAYGRTSKPVPTIRLIETQLVWKLDKGAPSPIFFLSFSVERNLRRLVGRLAGLEAPNTTNKQV